MATWMLPAAIGAGGGLNLIGTWLANNASQDAARRNERIAMQNMMAQRFRDASARADARLMREREMAGTTDEYGNRVYFVPDVGWVTDLAPEQQELLDASERNQLWQATVGERLRRELFERGASESRDDSVRRAALIDAITRQRTPTASSVGRQLSGAQTLAAADVASPLMQAINRVALRTGSGADMERTVSDAARETTRRSGQDAMSRRLSAMNFADNATSSQSNRLRTALSTGRTPQVTGPPQFRPPQVQRPSFGASNQASAIAQNRNAPQQPYINPDYAASSYFDVAGDTIDDFMMWYLLQGGNQAGGGIGGVTGGFGVPQSDRVRR